MCACELNLAVIVQCVHELNNYFRVAIVTASIHFINSCILLMIHKFF